MSVRLYSTAVKLTDNPYPELLQRTPLLCRYIFQIIYPLGGWPAIWDSSLTPNHSLSQTNLTSTSALTPSASSKSYLNAEHKAVCRNGDRQKSPQAVK